MPTKLVEIYWDPVTRTQIKERYYLLNGKKEGEYQLYHKNGRPHMSIDYLDGQVNGRITTFSELGRKKSVSFHLPNSEIVENIIYNENGDIRARYIIKDGCIQETSQAYYPIMNYQESES